MVRRFRFVSVSGEGPLCESVMGFPWTLQRYIFREMGRTFLLTAITLTGVLGLGGGVLNMIKLGDVTTGQLVRLMCLVVPIAAALTLPIAALFSAAATYGRLSADNEFVACRSSGINMHLLFLPTVVLSLLSAIVTFALINFVIPRMVRNLNEFVGADVGTLIQRRLSRPRGLTLNSKFRIHAERSEVDPENANRIILHRVSFIKTAGEEWAVVGAAQQVQLDFERRGQGYRAAATLYDVTAFDREKGQFFQQGIQTLFSDQIPLSVPEEIKFLTLGGLFYFRGRPTEWREVQTAMNDLRMVVGRRLIYDDLWDEWRPDEAQILTDEGVRYEFRSKSHARIAGDGGIELFDVQATETGRRGERRYRAARGLMEVKRGSHIDECRIEVELFDVEVGESARKVMRARKKLNGVPLRKEQIDRIESLSHADLTRIAGEDEIGGPLRMADRRVDEAIAETGRRIAATISERFAFSVSVFVLVILGAALGIIFRGTDTVTAFGVSFVPSLLVIITIVMGKQMAYNATTPVLGLLVMWSGIALVAALDAWTLTRVLRR
ncbi:MAG: LptF/LptG family permease [Planctomycetes bacterium]|nr:LptF/LptG family permease [Planctomycetota bacterium]